jgi:hypothetical protein
MFVAYFLWDAYHYGMQHFGVLSLYRRARRSRMQRRVDKWLCLVLTTVIGMIVLRKGLPMLPWLAHIQPRLLPAVRWFLPHIQQVGLFVVLGFLSVNHSTAAIGISSHVMANQHGRSPWLFAALLLVAGAVVLSLMFYASGLTMGITMAVMALRLGLGFVHFLYDRWVYKFSDPAVRASIGLAFSVVEQSPQLFRSEERAHA